MQAIEKLCGAGTHCNLVYGKYFGTVHTGLVAPLQSLEVGKKKQKLRLPSSVSFGIKCDRKLYWTDWLSAAIGAVSLVNEICAAPSKKDRLQMHPIPYASKECHASP